MWLLALNNPNTGGEVMDGIEGKVIQIEIAHTNWVGDTREHNPDPEKCWCWKEYDKRMKPKEK